MTARYLLVPGVVRSRADGDWHHVGAEALARLYGVSMLDCLVAREPPYGHRPGLATYIALLARADRGELVALRPRADGDYRLPGAAA